ncbi:4a-hydroxytetrahydrobiopterin dehydratase [Nakamurella endophytica]|uniref:Putative pterin-4-alpha-carbinolamine dehydratase n=1 Tax=Nakamurella endophytica TaxID=1748367 RepID=A0A917W9P9_9ACTN|nr:4a-hydroxytetrahydrobiopterin dehydratase [Nakamurella endophytica]GGL85776.1 hypothetical protein GCM10011594_01830 [Nakamurella endophytica]
MPEPLSAERIRSALPMVAPFRVDDDVDGSALVADFLAPDWRTAIELVRVVAAAAELADHHPDIDVRWRTVRFRVTTHSVGAVTDLDVSLAAQIVDAARRLGVRPAGDRS